jgi:hypothetical protein
MTYRNNGVNLLKSEDRSDISFEESSFSWEENIFNHFAQAVDTLHLTALLQNIPNFEDADFDSARSCHLNLVNVGISCGFSWGQYSRYQGDINNY